MRLEREMKKKGNLSNTICVCEREREEDQKVNTQQTGSDSKATPKVCTGKNIESNFVIQIRIP